MKEVLKLGHRVQLLNFNAETIFDDYLVLQKLVYKERLETMNTTKSDEEQEKTR